MKVQVTVNNVRIIEPSILNENEYNIHECEFEFTEEYNGLTKKAVFTNEANETYVETIVDNICSIPSEVLKDRENVKLGVYAYDVDNEELLLRYSPRPTEFYVHEGSYKQGQNSTPPTPSEVEQLQAQITQNANDIDTLEQTTSEHTTEISNIQAEQTEQSTKIQNNTDNISTINGQIVTINQDIDNLERTKADKSEIPTRTSDLINDSDFVVDNNYVHTDNNFTDEDEAQITTNKNDIATLQSTKADKSEIPTKTSQLTNDSGFINKNVNNLANYYKKSETYNKTEIDGKVSSVYKYKGTVATYQDLPSTDLTIGDVYNVEEDGSNYAWTGNSWDKLGGDIDLSEYYTKTQTDSLLSAKANSSDVYTKSETYTKAETNTLLNDKVDKEQGKGLSSNDFTDNDKNQIEANQTAITNIKDGTTIDSFGDVETALNSKEDKSNKVTELTDQSTDVEYPSAKCVYDELEAKQSEIDTLQQDVEDLRGACLSVEGTGTDITLNNTAKGRLLKNELSGRTEQEQLSGKNLFDMNKAINGYINSSGEIVNSNVNKCSDYIETILNNQYILSAYNENLVRYNYIYGVAFFDENKEFISRVHNISYNTPFTIENSNIKYIRVWEGVNTGETIGFIQLEQGSTATSYEPYCGGIPSPNSDYTQPIKNVTGNANIKIQNKNLFDESIFKQYDTKEDDEAYKMYNSQVYNKDLTPNISFKENTSYTLMYEAKQSSGNPRLAINYDDGTIAECPNTAMSINYTQYMLVTPSNKKIKNISLKYGGTGYVYIKKNSVMVLEGAYTSETIPEYVPHQEQNYPFTFAEGQRGMQGTQPKDDGIYNTRFQEELNTNSTITKVESALAPLGFYFTINISRLANYQSDSIVGNLISNRFKTVNNSVNLLNKGCMSMSSFANKLSLCVDETITTVEGLQTWLQNNTTIVEYDLAQPEIIPYNSTQQAQYDAIKNARSYDDITYITSTSDELGFNMDVESLANANKVIDSLDTRLLALESEV